MKYFIYEVSLIRNLQYDSDNISKKLDLLSLTECNYISNENAILENEDVSKQCLYNKKYQKFYLKNKDIVKDNLKRFLQHQTKRNAKKVIFKKSEFGDSMEKLKRF